MTLTQFVKRPEVADDVVSVVVDRVNAYHVTKFHVHALMFPCNEHLLQMDNHHSRSNTVSYSINQVTK